MGDCSKRGAVPGCDAQARDQVGLETIAGRIAARRLDGSDGVVQSPELREDERLAREIERSLRSALDRLVDPVQRASRDPREECSRAMPE